jgi:hypothetical protein
MAGPETDRGYRRRGDEAKCPACGVPMDPEAYRCPKCRIYFCFKCRRRVQPRDAQFQCMNQQCGYYGKLLCNACVVEVPRLQEQTRKVVVAPARTAALVPGQFLFGLCFATLVIGATVGHGVGLPPAGAWCGGLLVAAIMGVWLASMESRFSPEYQTVVETVEVGRVKSCIACRQAVEHLK